MGQISVYLNRVRTARLNSLALAKDVDGLVLLYRVIDAGLDSLEASVK